MLKELEELMLDKNNLVSFEQYFEQKNSLKIKLPLLRKIAIKFAKEKNYNFFYEKHNFLEEYIIHAYMIGYLKEDIFLCLKYAEEFIPLIDNWIVNDCFCQNLKWAKKYQKEVFDIIKKYQNSKKEFEVRVITVILLSHFLNDEYIDLVFNIIDNLYLEDYMAKMGASWLLATAMAKYEEKTLIYLNKCHLNKWVIKKSISKSLESFRVSENAKNKLKKLRNNL